MSDAPQQPTLDHQRATQSERIERLIRLNEVLKKTGQSRSGLYAAEAAGVFPKSIAILPNGRVKAWLESEVDAWIHERIAAERASRKGSTK